MTRISYHTCTVLILAVLALSACGNDRPTLDTSGLLPSPMFRYSDTLTGRIVKSSSPKDVGDQITFIGLATSSPRMVFARTGGTSPMTILVETDALISLQLVTGHSVDAFLIEKKPGFSLAHTLA